VTSNLPALRGADDIRPVRAKVVAVCLFATLAGCGSGSAPPPASAAEPPRPAPAEPSRPPPGTLWREDVDAAIKAGLGHFLQHVELEAALDNGQFVGFRIVRLEPPELWRGIDLQPGDVVTRVNGMPIERETQAYDAFMARGRRAHGGVFDRTAPQTLSPERGARGAPARSLGELKAHHRVHRSCKAITIEMRAARHPVDVIAASIVVEVSDQIEMIALARP
jgi:hypothetical protein